MKTNLLKSLFISLILVMGVSNAWAYDIKCTFIYDNSKTQWSSVQLMVGHNSWSQGYVMKKIDNTQLWYYTFSSTWGGATQICVFNASSAWGGEGSSVSHRSGYMDQNTAVKNLSGNMTDGVQLITTTNGNDGTAMSTAYHSTYTGLNTNQNATVQSTTDGSTYSDNSNAGSVSISTYKLKSTSASEASTGTTSASAARTAVVTMTATAKTGYTFVDWCNSSNTQQTTSTSLTYNCSGSTATYKARFKANQYTIQFNANGGSGTMSNQSYAYGESKALTANAFTKTGYNFAGWNTKADGTGNKYTDKQSVSNLSSTNGATITLYAQWELATYTITYNDLKGATHTNPATYTINSATITFTAPTSKPAGYTFANWSPASIATGSTGDKTVTANWIAATSTVELNQEEATEKGTASVTATYGSAMPAITKLPIRTGYTFGGYYTGKNGAGTQYYKADGTSATTWNLEGAQTLYAKWTATPYNITYTNLGGATHTNAKTYTIEDAIRFSEPSTRNGYTFAGWYPASIEKGSTGDKTITAQWTEKPANTVYFKPQSWWKDNDARTAIWAWKENSNPAVEGWVDVDYDDCTDSILRAEIPAKYDRIKFVRLKPSSASGYSSENNGYNWANQWNSTENLTVPTDNKNLYDITTSANAHLFFKSNSNWTADGARTAAYFFGNGATWVSMTDIGDGIYYCEKPSGYTKVIFGRMNPGTNDNNFNDGVRWNQTGDLTLPTDGKNLYTISGGLNNLSGTWSTGADNVFDNHRWTTYTAPTYQIQIMPCTNGTITVKYGNQTCTSTTIKQTMEVPLHAELTITLTPLNGYQPTTPQVTFADIVGDNIYSICGPATISAEFVPKGTTKTIYLRPNDDWLHDDAVFIAHAWKENSSDQHDYLMTTKETDYTGSYSCTIDSKYDHVLFARINPEHKDNQELKAEWMWNKTKDLQITDDVLNEHGYRFAILNKVGGTGEDKDFYDGKWEENTPIWGLTADFNLWHAEDAIFRGYPGKVDILLHSGTHEFLLYNIKTGSYFHNNGTYTRGNSDQWWSMDVNTQDNCKLVADVDNALYHFLMQYVTQVGEFKKQISITYPNTDVYYLAYQEGEDSKSFRKSHALNKITEGEKEDTVSFFVNADESPYIYLIDNSNNILSKHPITETAGEHPNGAMLPNKRNSPTLSIGSGCGVKYSGVYNFILHQEGNNAKIDAGATHPYSGDYYIRTDAAEGGWNDFRQESNLMTFSTFAESHSNFNHYFCKWINGTRSNVKFTIANNYSYSLSDTLNNDRFIQDEEGYLPDSANVRFGWDSRTNEVSRAYLKGSGHAKDRFLVLIGENENLKDSVGNIITEGTGNNEGINANEVLFLDAGNWVYQVDVKANRNTKIKLTAEYNNLVQYFKGSENEYMNLLSSDTEQDFKIRLIYDFKTNHLVVAWLPESEITTDFELSSDMMIIRRNQENAMQVHFNPNSKQVSGIGTGYAVMTFTKSHVNGNTSDYNRALYWVSFPFDVRLKEVFGFGEYGQHWIMEYYDGAARAANGLWIDSDTYWKYITNPDYTLKAGQGYVLCLNLGKMGTNSAVFANTDEVSLYFPSASPLQTITGEVTTAEVTAHTCTIERDYRYIYDSNWNLIGVPGFKDITSVGVGGSAHENADPNVSADCVSFYYAYQPDDNSYLAEAKMNNFQTMFSYMVQFAGTIEWSSPAFKAPSSVAARRAGEMPSEHTLRLEFLQSETLADQTIVKLQEQDATADFDMNIDMAKMMNSGTNIYTMTANTNIMVGGNALPIARTTVPVGVRVDATGEYTFRMPDGTDGISVILLDNQTGAHTNMLLDEYTVILEAGTYENRFSLVLDPQRTSTEVENIGDGYGDGVNGNGTEGIKKYIIDGQLFIRTANGLFDAKGQRL